MFQTVVVFKSSDIIYSVDECFLVKRLTGAQEPSWPTSVRSPGLNLSEAVRTCMSSHRANFESRECCQLSVLHVLVQVTVSCFEQHFGNSMTERCDRQLHECALSNLTRW